MVWYIGYIGYIVYIGYIGYIEYIGYIGYIQGDPWELIKTICLLLGLENNLYAEKGVLSFIRYVHFDI